MSYGAYASRDFRRQAGRSHHERAQRDRTGLVRPSRAFAGWLAPGSCIMATAVLVSAFVLQDRSHAPLKIEVVRNVAPHPSAGPAPSLLRPLAPPRRALREAADTAYAQLLDPGFMLGAAPAHFAIDMPKAEAFAYAEAVTAPVVEAAVAERAQAEPAAPAVAPVILAEEPELPLPPVPEVALDIPLPIPRPPVLNLPPVVAPLRGPSRRYASARAPIASAAQPDQRSFFEKLFGTPQATGPALAYASPEDGLFKRPSVAAVPTGQATAIYDISAHTVYLPSGERLEAHSGLREKIDDPRFVNERMRGATPPAIYDLTPREALFHGVRALRLTPIGGGTTYGRSGLLAHTFMLGPSGQSNGCVSFRNYNAFLAAYQRGEIRRLLVVAHM